MTPYVTDANVIFASLISGKDIYKKMFRSHKFYLPDFALAEIQKYQPEILQKTKLLLKNSRVIPWESSIT